MSENIVICWFRQDLRLADNPALTAAARTATKQNIPVLPIYIMDETIGAASRWWLHNSLQALASELGAMSHYRGEPVAVFGEIAKRFNVRAVYWNRCYEPHRIKQDDAVAAWCTAQNIGAESFNAALLWEPHEIAKKDGTPYRVFTPFYRKGCLGEDTPPPRKPLPRPALPATTQDKNSVPLAELQLQEKWSGKFAPHWQVGEAAAKKALKKFLQNGLRDYAHGRDFPAAQNVSRLSPHLHFGEISPHIIWEAVRRGNKPLNDNADKFCSEIAWRELSHSLLFYNPDIATQNLQTKFDNFEWREDETLLQAWQRGATGFPFVDAAMRELWQTGYMHNRARMVAASFLVKNLLQDWRCGERWFWDTLVDADAANNSASWQWVAGCGADAAPYFRIFNPLTQSKRFDPQGEYIRRFVPELAALPTKYLHAPHAAPAEILEQAGVKIGDTYPAPICDLKQSRDAALATFHKIRTAE